MAKRVAVKGYMIADATSIVAVVAGDVLSSHAPTWPFSFTSETLPDERRAATDRAFRNVDRQAMNIVHESRRSRRAR